MGTLSLGISFFQYVLLSLEHPPGMFLSGLATCCAMLFLTRSDPELLRVLAHKWGVCFLKNRKRLIDRLRTRDQNFTHGCSLFSSRDSNGVATPLKQCDVDECVSHLFRILNTLASMYFSCNWRQMEEVISMNMECEQYVREHILPVCMATDPEEDVADEEETLLRMPFWRPLDTTSQLSAPIANGHSNGYGGSSYNGCNEASKLTPGLQDTRSLLLGTLSNVLEHGRLSPNGLVLVFHASFSEKSCEALAMLRHILKEKRLSPAPEVSLVYAATEPELVRCFSISWFPTIIYIPPTAVEQQHSLSSKKNKTLENMTKMALSSSNGCTGTTVSDRSSPRRSGLSSEVSSLTVEETTTSLPTRKNSFTNGVDLSSIIKPEYCRVYPENGALTIPALVEWINGKGHIPAQVTDDKQGVVNHLNEFREDAKFKKCREPVSCAMILRRLQRPLQECHPTRTNESPVFIFFGGGIAAGKSTLAAALSRTAWWERHKSDIVAVNADDFKTDATRCSEGNNGIHERSTRAAEELMVRAINQGRNIVFDSTMMWCPFIMEVIEMVRNAHTTLYEQGPGYCKETGTEEYFKPLRRRPEPLPKPYEIRMFAITVQPESAVPRGILRRFSTGRAVPIATQIRSFRLFSENFGVYLDLVDAAILYNNNVFVDLEKGELPPVLAEKTEHELLIHDTEAYELFKRQRRLNDKADSALGLYLSQEEIKGNIKQNNDPVKTLCVRVGLSVCVCVLGILCIKGTMCLRSVGRG